MQVESELLLEEKHPIIDDTSKHTNLHFSQDLPFLIGLRDHMGLDFFLQVMYSCYQLHSYNSKWLLLKQHHIHYKDWPPGPSSTS